MPLDVIGAGFGRTGTLSMQAALEQLGDHIRSQGTRALLQYAEVAA